MGFSSLRIGEGTFTPPEGITQPTPPAQPHQALPATAPALGLGFDTITVMVSGDVDVEAGAGISIERWD